MPHIPLPITSPVGILAMLSTICAFFFWLEKRTRWKVFQIAPPLLFIYLLPVLMTTSGVLPKTSPVYSTTKGLLLPMLLILLLLKLNLRGAARILGRGLGVMLIGSVGVMIGAPIGMLLMKPWLGPDAWKSFGSLAASWVGGTANLFAVAEMTHANGAESLSVFSDSVIAYMIWLPILLASKRFAARFARFTGADTSAFNTMEEDASTHDERAAGPTTIDYLLLISAALAATWIAELGATAIVAKINDYFPPHVAVADGGTLTAGFVDIPSATPRPAAKPLAPQTNPFADMNTWRILLVTTFGIALSFSRLSRIHGSLELAMALLYLFVSCMGATADLSEKTDEVLPFFLGSLVMIFIHGAFTLLGAKLLRTDIHTAAIASAANIGGVATSSIVASYHKRSLLPAAVLMAIIGIAIGTYCGYATALICRALS